MSIENFKYALLLFLAIVPIIGCNKGPKLNEVSGYVTINGNPPNAPLEILFHPVIQGTGTANGGTAEDGSYSLLYPGGGNGVPAGEYTVTITLMPDFEQEGIVPPRIPEKYNTQTELKATVQSGKNENVNFDLQL